MRLDSRGPTLLLLLLLVGSLAFSGWEVAHRLAALEIAAASPDFEGFSQAIEWDASNPEFYWRRGRIARDRAEAGEPGQVEKDFRTAVALNPLNWFYWGDLGFHEEISGRLEEAEHGFRTAARLSPMSGDVRWNLANFLLRRGRREEWLRELGAAVELDPRYREPGAALLTRMRASIQEVDAVWPTDRSSRLALLRFLCGAREQDGGDLASDKHLSALWNQALSASPDPLTPVDADFYFNTLLQRGNPQQARQAWNQLMRHNGFEDAAFSAKDNYIWDGGFEFPAFNRGLSWSIYESNQYRILRTNGRQENRTVLVKLEFDGNSNMNLRNLQQTVVVDAPGDYRLSFRARSELPSGDQGLYFHVGDPSIGSLVRSEQILGSRPWKSYSVTFRVPPGSQTLLIDLRRDRSRRLSGDLEGTVWLDDVRLEKLG